MSNITDLQTFIKRREEIENGLTYLQEYSCDSGDLAIDFDSKLRMVQAKLINAWYREKDLRAADLLRLVNIGIKVLNWVVIPPDIMGNVASRESKGPDKTLSIYLFGAPITRAKEPDDKGPLKSSIGISIGYMDIDPEDDINTGMVYDTSEFVFGQESDNFTHENIPRTILKNMNTLVLVNGGKGSLAIDEGIYVVFIPHTVSKVIMIAYQHDQPFRVPTEDEEDIGPIDS